MAIRGVVLGITVDVSAGMPDMDALQESSTTEKRAKLITFVNPASVVLARRKLSYRAMLGRFERVFPDGIGVCWALRMLHGIRSQRLSFDSTSLAPFVLRWASDNRLTIALVGGREGVAERAATRLAEAFPRLEVISALDGFGDPTPKLEELLRRQPKLVICGMGAPQQEQFLELLAAAGWVGLGFTCGGYLDQLGSGFHYYPRWVDAANVRWAYRILREPRRLARRYFVDYGEFLLCVGTALLKRRPPFAREDRLSASNQTGL